MTELKDNERAKRHPWDYYNFGIAFKRHMYETAKPGDNPIRESLGVIIDIALGDLTLSHTPEEYAQDLPDEYKFLKEGRVGANHLTELSTTSQRAARNFKTR